MKPAEAVNKAYEVKSLEAAKILNTTHIFAPSRQRSAQNYVETLKTLSNFYVRSSNSKEKRWKVIETITFNDLIIFHSTHSNQTCINMRGMTKRFASLVSFITQ